MPVRELSPGRSSEHHTLVGELAAEWIRRDSANSEPAIYIERGRRPEPTKVYVVWSKWADMDRVERSEIVIEAAEQVLPREEVLDIAVAMGLTREEATRMGMIFQ